VSGTFPRFSPSRQPELSIDEAPEAWAAALGISREAVEIYCASEVIDLHVDSAIWARLFGYDISKRHGRGLLDGLVYSQVDLPRVRAARLGGAIWSITTNPIRPSENRRETFLSNLRALCAVFEREANAARLVRNLGEYRAARERGLHAVLLGVQGGNALDHDATIWQRFDPALLIKVTLLHLSSSKLGTTSAPLRGTDVGLSSVGREFVEALDSQRIFVDLAHISPKGFWAAVEAHARELPFIVSHTGVSGVTEHWRNLDDEQLRAVGDSGGVVGVIFHSAFLGDPLFAGRAESIVRHLEHVANVAGESATALGSDFDGAICPPRDLRTVVELPRLVELMLRRGWAPERIQGALGENFLSALGRLRP
jgi:membrane dipeptidase